MDIDSTSVPQREAGMTPYEIMLSESQERMLVVVEKGREAEIEAIFDKWDLHAEQHRRGHRHGERVRVYWHGELVADVPAETSCSAAARPVYHRETRAPGVPRRDPAVRPRRRSPT